ncbi:MAG: hypothetical protein LC804_26635 [Acidobacteria bacterium]|nr:hypothetical protein [Acidobacteriota bacterium]
MVSSELVAYYDPGKPGDATLRPRQKSADWVGLVVGMGCQVLGGCLYLGAFG